MAIHSDSMLPLLTSFILLCNFSGSLGSSVFCYSPCNREYTTGSNFESNLQQLLNGLPLNDYFHIASYGEAPDQVYSLTMCYTDVSSKACNKCLIEALTGITEGCCAFKKNRLAWFDGCMIRISDEDFKVRTKLRLLSCGRKVPDPDRELDSLDEAEKFRDTLQQLFDSLSTNASGSPLRMTAGKMNYTSIVNIYALVQCTRNLASEKCREHIGILTDFGVEECTGGNTTAVPVDVIFKTESCYARFALKPFYVIPEAHPPWSNSGKRSKEPIPTYMLTIIIGGFIGLHVSDAFYQLFAIGKNKSIQTR